MRTTYPGSALALASGKAPVDRLRALLGEQPVRAAERPRAEEAVVRRERAGVRGLDARRAAQQRLEVAGVAAPEDRHERRVARGERADGRLGHRLPAAAAM